MSIPELTFWQKYCCCCCCGPCQTTAVTPLTPPPVLSVTTEAEKARNFQNRINSKRHNRLSSTEMLTARGVLNMDDSEYAKYMKNRPNPLAAAVIKPQSDPLPTPRQVNAVSINLLALNNLPPSQTP